ncbi:MAG: DNA mismatch repair protein MutS [Erythrobacter sp.]|jgi:DNA mismatch repair protein MutS|nr:DNA mismatch repair protein MutS [Erythrobacter sp.]
MMVQYLALKEQAGDSLLFYRMGDFFELFFEDAKVAASILDIALTTRGEHEGEPVPMCGVPVHSAESYLARLIRAGRRIAVAEQVETPEEAKERGGSKALVKRDIVRFVTAGTVFEEAVLDPRRANRLAAACAVRERIGIAVVDVSTGQLELEECGAGGLAPALARIGAQELIVPDGFEPPPGGGAIRGQGFDSEQGRQRLAALNLVPDKEPSRPALAALGGLLAYLEHTGCGTMPLLLPPTWLGGGGMAMDPATRASLEIVATVRGTRAGSLLDTVDRCCSAGGARLLADDLATPLTDIAAIEERLQAVARFERDPLLRGDTREALRRLPDLARALGRIVAGRGSPRDLGQMRDALAGAAALARLLGEASDRPTLIEREARELTGHEKLVETLRSALVETPPTERSAGGYIAEGAHAELDRLRKLAAEGRRAIAALEVSYRETTGIGSLKIKHNNVLGYFIEVPARHGEALAGSDAGFTHRQTLAGTMRFNSGALHEEAASITQAAARAHLLEEEVFADLVRQVTDRREAVARTAASLARIDVCAGNAERAVEGRWARPQLVDKPCLEVAGGRHPIVEAALAQTGKERFVANDCHLGPDDRLWLIGGPNMGGKSTFLRQNALIVLMAQAGCFVPASSAVVGIADRLFSRVGASDNLAEGRSTFMVEMVETASILTQATERSFIILDEVGRGTSTYDGLAIAWAVAEAVHGELRCRCLFASHYHELAALAQHCEALSLHHVRAREWKGELVLLHELAKGAADRSYGLAVAKLAGVPPPVVERARAVLEKLETNRAETGGLAAGLGDLPLFAASVERERAEDDRLHAALAELDVDALSPREALDKLYALKQMASEARRG